MTGPTDSDSDSDSVTVTASPPNGGGGGAGWGGGVLRGVIWTAGSAVALGAAAATAHGLYEVAVAARVPRGIAWLYPIITDGLALVAYAATARLRGREARYAWGVVVVAAGLSGLAQAAYLAGADGTGASGPIGAVDPALRFGVGAWPAIAAAIVAHLLYLLATSERHAVYPGPVVHLAAGVQPPPVDGAAVQPAVVAPGVQPVGTAPLPGAHDAAAETGDAPARALPSPARDRADAAALRWARRHGAWPTVTELETAAGVSRGTAAAALKTLRERPLPLHALPPDTAGPVRPDSRSDAPPSPAATARAATDPDGALVETDERDQADDQNALPDPEASR